MRLYSDIKNYGDMSADRRRVTHWTLTVDKQRV